MLNVRSISCGYNYHFGAAGAGDITVLHALCKQCGVALHVAPCADYRGEPISSSRIRRAVAEGEMEDVYQMLGRPFSYDFQVVSGDRRGRVLGFPTINQFSPRIMPCLSSACMLRARGSTGGIIQLWLTLGSGLRLERIPCVVRHAS